MKLLYLRDFLMENSDEEHPLTVQQMIDHLKGLNISSERKSVYRDLEDLIEYGVDIRKKSDGRYTYYYVENRTFNISELKVLVDVVQVAKFITPRKTQELISKIEHLCSKFQAQKLQHQVFIRSRIKSDNESIYENVNVLHDAITSDRKIRFHYFEYIGSREPRIRKGGAYYFISPYALNWDDENYYLIGYDSYAGILKHFRVDKMKDLELMDSPREGKEAFSSEDMGVYSKKVFGMYSGKETELRLRFHNQLAGPVMDQMGSDLIMVPDGPEHFIVHAQVFVSPQFFAWMCGFTKDAQILGPDWVVEKMRRHVLDVASVYIGTPESIAEPDSMAEVSGVSGSNGAHMETPASRVGFAPEEFDPHMEIPAPDVGSALEEVDDFLDDLAPAETQASDENDVPVESFAPDAFPFLMDCNTPGETHTLDDDPTAEESDTPVEGSDPEDAPDPDDIPEDGPEPEGCPASRESDFSDERKEGKRSP